MNWHDVRAEYPSLQNCTYLNSATFGQLAKRTQAAVSAHFARRDRLACADFLTWFDDMDELRALIGKLINCNGSDIAFVTNASAALSLFLGGIDWQPGDRIATLPNEFPNQYYYAQWLGAKGVELVEVPDLAALPERTKAVVLSTVNYTNGYRPDLVAIGKLAREAGALLYVDGTQSLGALQFDVQAVRPDMFAVDGYKWMLSPNGATFFYITPELRRMIAPAVIGWRSDQGWRSVDDLNHGVPQFPEAAERYEGGMLNFPSLYGMAEAVRTLLDLGPANVERRVLELAGLTAGILRDAGAQIRTTDTNILAAHWECREASQLALELKSKGIVVAARHGNLRVSPHFYNTEDDLEIFRGAL
ncbi:MAG: aminotransferase class V-fold PLP-dependent enzyme [Bryobacterales bacterium]|nr:aminotransferase class V-fold PLP-dependent enzyme [Bryobacterales bacterium]